MVSDTLDSIRMFMTKDVLVITDGAAHWKPKRLKKEAEVLRRHDPFEGRSLDAHRVEGFYHARSRGPFRNLTLGLKTLAENWNADWYCYIEYDCLVASDDFKGDLENAGRRGVWAIGNDHRCANYRMPLLEKVVGPIGESHVLLGCCNFFHADFVRELVSRDFFSKFLCLTNCFRETVPDFDEQGAYDFGEVVYPTLAAHYGGKVDHFAHYNDMLGWSGNAERYPMRFRPDIDADFPDASIIHPLKNYDDPIRAYHRERRRRQDQWKLPA